MMIRPGRSFMSLGLWITIDGGTQFTGTMKDLVRSVASEEQHIDHIPFFATMCRQLASVHALILSLSTIDACPGGDSLSPSCCQ